MLADVIQSECGSQPPAFAHFVRTKSLPLIYVANLACQIAAWWVEEDLNLRPHAYQACALTT